jgi:DNA modification methylase
MISHVIKHGDCLEWLRKLKAESIDAIVTDPPYGLEFMGKDWDAPWKAGFSEVSFRPGFAPPNFSSNRNPVCRTCHKHKRGKKRCECSAPDFDESPADSMRLFQRWCEGWAREALRVLKPGGHLLAFGGTRTYHRLACAIEDAGFEIRDSLDWIYGQGFPKSLDVSKAIGKVNPALALDAERFSGWGTALKPAHEPIVLARKPLAGTVAANVLRYGTGALNVDGCRVESGARPLVVSDRGGEPGSAYAGGLDGSLCGSRAAGDTTAGRWPPNLLLTHSPECAGTCAPGCPVAMMDAQSGTLKSGEPGVRRKPHETNAMAGMLGLTGERETGIGDAGGASRFFPTFSYDDHDLDLFLYCAKASTKDRGGKWNNHPTVKPIALMRWLVRLVTPPGGVVLDPFLGSGTSGVAALREGFSFIGIEREAPYVEIATRRIAEVTAA